MNKLALTLKYLLVYLAVSSFLALAGCNTYVAGMRWHHLDVIVAAPPPQPYPYLYEYYYSPVYRAYYCYYPNYGWVYQPGPPPPNAVYWNGPVPAYLAAPGPTAGIYFYFDPLTHVYYYRGAAGHWRYYHGPPPSHARFWGGPHPRALPLPPRGAPRQHAPGRRDRYHP